MMTPVLETLERYAAIDPAIAYWIEDENGGATDCEDYCRECAEKAALRFPGARLCSDGGVWSESDSCRHCATCGKLLRYVLTNYGVMAELEHFTMHPPKTPLSKEEAFHIARMLAGGDDCPEVVAVAQHAVALITAKRSLRRT